MVLNLWRGPASIKSYTGVPRLSRAAAFDLSDLFQRDTRAIQHVSAASRERCIVRDKVAEAHAFVSESDIDGVPCIVCLLSARRPPQVPALVSLVVVDAVDLEFAPERVVRVSDGPHVLDEDQGIAELLGQTDTPGSVVSVLPVDRVFAPSADGEPLAPNPLVDFIGRPPPPHVPLTVLRGGFLGARLAPRSLSGPHVVP